MSLNPDIGTKVTTKKAEKNTYEKKTIESFFTKLQKNKNGNICIFCQNF